ncbi:bifunctional diaminohydroxyphosphoribosylaminopyrimidine deaminase/5-amino-6-(5-phosphoribosylamino)uracil reductase RibD [Capnocytophaga sp. oral taxon 878]|uniref:bifunctional diaminohydroxyphosphoribosylaminopyrimidine deaminase/5-amino-6-(5-phosphoribosylamino)uracil reductase RibD n=1 Tax=Capnocytophaga sp. oral taxon 878 TaxID=1316596 RepID=UPI000D0440AE|nr:bifunctional diaminohydroxyphosphoribosylaminopyrimidine deaminase/5-amino-6-(5-phosphoribosylamino)uracil reductase RibD [Capnocytophaga sp. oral taxon 878]AVM51040.1 bifunctional diaminohydroxyphosphoribosylaminopyrimidine deaminase/5-amino-6-(5-phosphoribosylamino)uracil reductase RibD [Capnocytophaga sp. oral taxon 878]
MIKRCIQLAYNGLGTTYPNPMVGCVIVHEGKIIGEGWHQKAGEPHAEVRAIASVKDKSLLAESTLYVSLEPCCHYGKTPPCTDLIIAHRIPRVVVGCTDPFAKVAGQGIEKLRAAGCEVTVGVMKDECLLLNKRFFTFHLKKRPYIFLKWAETADGYIAPATKTELAPVWITNAYTRQEVHQLRSTEQAILVGVGTVLADNPSLDTRNWYGKSPLRVIIDPQLRTPNDFKVWNDQVPTLFITDKKTTQVTNKQQTEIVTINFQEDVPQQVCDILYQRNIQSLIVEGGAYTLQQFINANLYDETLIYRSDVEFGSGVKAPRR